MIVEVLAIAETLAPKRVARKIAARMLRFHRHWARSFSVRISSAAAPVLERIIYLNRVVPHKTIRAIGASMTATKHRLHVLRVRATASQRADSAPIEIIRQTTHDVRRGGNQDAVSIEPEGERVRSVAVTKRIRCVDDRRFPQSELTEQLGIRLHNVIK